MNGLLLASGLLTLSIAVSIPTWFYNKKRTTEFLAAIDTLQNEEFVK